MALLKYVLIFFTSSVILACEWAWNRLWPLFSLTAVYAALVLMGLNTVFGATGQKILWLLCVCGGLIFIYFLGRQTAWPRVAAIKRRIEMDNGLHHAPLSHRNDTPAFPLTEQNRILWYRHLQQQENALKDIGSCTLKLTTARQDPYGIRHAALLLLVIGLSVAGPERFQKLSAGLRPPFSLPSAPVQQASMDIWIEPPEYTKVPFVFLKTTRVTTAEATVQRVIHVPQNSLLKIRAPGQMRAPKLRYAGTSHTLTSEGADTYAIDLPLTEDGMLTVRILFQEEGRWPVQVVQDQPPSVVLKDTKETPYKSLQIIWDAFDDYGVTETVLHVVPDRNPRDALLIDLPSGTGESLSQSVDLTASLYAGDDVTLTLTTKDAMTQETVSAPFRARLPERMFQNPLAQQLVDIRKQLVTQNSDDDLINFAEELRNLYLQPELYNGDRVVFMVLGSLWRRLAEIPPADTLHNIQRLLWDTALRLEDGGLSAAQRDLDQALQDLSRVADDGKTTQEDMRAALSEVQEKMRTYMQALAQDMAQRLAQGQTPSVLPKELADKFTNAIDLDDMMKQLQELAEQGDKDALQRMTDMLKDAVGNMNPEFMATMQEQQKQAVEALKDLQNLIDDQQDVMEKTDRLDKTDATESLVQAQKSLRQDLGEIVKKMSEAIPEIPDSFAEANQSMMHAEKSLEEKNKLAAVVSQRKALEALQKGTDQSIAAMARQMRNIIFSINPGDAQQGYGAGYDPLGRENGQGQREEDVTIPDEDERRRIQEILRALRDRANDYQRPKVERQYLDRLLDMTN